MENAPLKFPPDFLARLCRQIHYSMPLLDNDIEKYQEPNIAAQPTINRSIT